MDNRILNSGMDALLARFRAPGAEFRGKPFWSWNGELEKDELLRQVDVMKEMGFGGYFMHSRSGLITEYLGDEWFEFINDVADYGEKVGMESWLYDEDRWPSGSAGGIVTRDPAYRMKSLYVFEMSPAQFTWDGDVLRAFAAKVDGNRLLSYREITAETDPAALAEEDPSVRILKFAIVPDAPESVYNGTTYIDTMMLAATEKFLELTHEEYLKRCGDRIGTSIRGIFTDEPHRGKFLSNRQVSEDGIMSCAISYTDDIFEELEKRYGYDARGRLPELFYRYDGDGTARLKHDYTDLACNLFNERFAVPINEWCRKHGIAFTGHVLHENSFMNQTVPNGSLMRFYENMGIPGIDILTEYDHCYWAARQVSSAARQMGQKWILSELYGCTGWQFSFRSHKAVGDWQALFGVNVRCPHLSWYTMEGEAKRDYPASILHQSAWYKYYDYVESYFARFGVVMTEGEPVCEVLVLNAIESSWLKSYAGWTNWISTNDPEVAAMEAHYAKLFGFLAGRQIDFDYGEEFLMAKHGSAGTEGGRAVLRIGKMAYTTVVISGALTLRSSTVKLLEEFAALGGKIIVAGKAPEMVDAEPSDAFAALCEKYGAETVDFEADALARAIRKNLSVTTGFSGPEGVRTDSLFCQVRDCREDGAVIAAVLNVDREAQKKAVRFEIAGIGGVEQVQEWHLLTGRRTDITDACVIGEKQITVTTDFEPCGEHIFVFLRKKEAGVPAARKKQTAVRTETVCGKVAYTLSEKNVLVLDYVRSSFQGGPFTEPEEILRADRRIRDAVGIEHRSGNMLQPWYAKKYADEAYGSLTLAYEFYIDEMPEGGIVLAGERPELFSYEVNGTALSPDGGFWVDRCFKTMPIPREALRLGKNTVTARTEFRRTTNLESLYLVGDFGVRMEKKEQSRTRRLNDRGRFFGNEKHITALPAEIGFDNLAEYGLPFYSGFVTYRIPAGSLPAVDAAAGERLFLKAEDFVGAAVRVTGEKSEEAALIAWEPYEADVTALAGGEIEVTLLCTRKNTFGPLHLIPAVPGAVGPGHFTTGGASFSDDYVLMDSGIFGGIGFEVRR